MTIGKNQASVQVDGTPVFRPVRPPPPAPPGSLHPELTACLAIAAALGISSRNSGLIGEESALPIVYSLTMTMVPPICVSARARSRGRARARRAMVLRYRLPFRRGSSGDARSSSE